MNQALIFQNLIVQVFSDKTDQDIIHDLSQLSNQELQMLLTPTNEIQADKTNHVSLMHLFPLRIEVFKWLVEQGGDPFVQDDEGKMPSDLLNPEVDTETYSTLNAFLNVFKEKKQLEKQMAENSEQANAYKQKI